MEQNKTTEMKIASWAAVMKVLGVALIALSAIAAVIPLNYRRWLHTLNSRVHVSRPCNRIC